MNAEQNLIGCLCLGASPKDLVVDARWFGSARARAAWEAAIRLDDWGHEITPSTILGELQGPMKAELTWEMLTEWSNQVASARQSEFWSEKVRAEYQKRQVCILAKQVETCGDGPIPPELLQSLQEALESQVAPDLKSYEHTAREAAQGAWEAVEAASARGTALTGVPSGLCDLDGMTNGFQPGELVVLAARPSHGKTAMAGGWILHAASHGTRVCFYTLEMGVIPIVTRMIAARSMIPGTRLRNGRLQESEWTVVGKVSQEFGGLPIDFVDKPGMTLQEIRAHARRKNPGLIVVDYLQLVEGLGRSESRQVTVGATSRGLKGLARELKVPVVALSQLRRGSEDRQDHEPKLHDLRESGDIEQDADLVMLLNRPDAYRKPSEYDGKAILEVAKQRNGPVGRVTLTWEPKTTTFRNYGGDDRE
jgi:replicative DNA helicase